MWFVTQSSSSQVRYFKHMLYTTMQHKYKLWMAKICLPNKFNVLFFFVDISSGYKECTEVYSEFNSIKSSNKVDARASWRLKTQNDWMTQSAKSVRSVRFIYVINCNLLIWMDDTPHTWIVKYAKQSKVSSQISYDWVAHSSITAIVKLSSIFFQSSWCFFFVVFLFVQVFHSFLSSTPFALCFRLQSQ